MESTEKKYTIEELKEKLFSSIYDNSKIKEAILMQIILDKPFNVLLIGDPGTGKSLFLKNIKELNTDKVQKVVDKDNIEISYADNFCLIERLHVIDFDFNLNIYMENKNTLAVGNPKFGRWDPYGGIAEQIGLTPGILSKFNLIFLLTDTPDKRRDEIILNYVYKNYINQNQNKISEEILSYLNQLKETKVSLSESLLEETKKYYTAIRNTGTTIDGYKPVPITARQIETLFKLSEGYAKLRNKTIADAEDMKSAIELLNYCLEQIGIDPKTGMLDIDRICNTLTQFDRIIIKNIVHIMKEIEQEKPDITFVEIITQTERFEYDNELVIKVLNKLKEEGVIFEPRKNIFKFLE